MGLGVTKIWFVLQLGFNDTMAPYYDALDLSLSTRIRGGRVVYCGSCVVHRLPGSESKLMEYHRAREPATTQSSVFMSTWSKYLERMLKHDRKSDKVLVISAPISRTSGVPAEVLTLLLGLEDAIQIKLRDDTYPGAPLRLDGVQYPDWVEETLIRMSDRRLSVRSG